MVRAAILLASASLAVVNGLLSYTALVDGRRDFAAIAAVASITFLALAVEIVCEWAPTQMSYRPSTRLDLFVVSMVVLALVCFGLWSITTGGGQ